MTYKYNKIMVIDDNEIDTYITNTLIKKNYLAKEILQYNNGLKAISYLEKYKNDEQQLPELILLDIYMPRMDGFEFLYFFSKIESEVIKKCKICIVSSSIDDNDIIKSKLDKNVCTFITKPLTIEIFNTI